MYQGLSGVLGTQPFLPVFNQNPQTSPGAIAGGTILLANDPWWGGGEFIYARAAGAIRANGLCVLTPVFDTALSAYRWDATEVPATANLGRTLAVAKLAMVAGDFNWFQVGGLCPVDCNASVAADTTFGIAAAGQGGANVAGRQVLNARIIAPGSTTVVKANGAGAAGSTVIQVSNTEGWFPGLFISGTGIGASARIASIDSSGRFVGLTVANSALVSGNITGTYNNATIFYNVAHLNRPFAQGAIT